MINIIEEFRQHKNEENAEKQAAYLRHQFEFIGLKTPERRLLAKDFLKENGNRCPKCRRSKGELEVERIL